MGFWLVAADGAVEDVAARAAVLAGGLGTSGKLVVCSVGEK